jgi:hypothetical protein
MTIPADSLRYNVRYEPLDQVNLIFQGLDNSSRLLSELLGVLDGSRWKPGAQAHEYLLEGDSWFRHERSWRTLGPFNDRYHVRFWHGDGEILGSAHKERLKKWPPSHEIESFDQAKVAVAEVFREAGWTVYDNARDLSRDNLVWPIDLPRADGKASVIILP